MARTDAASLTSISIQGSLEALVQNSQVGVIETGTPQRPVLAAPRPRYQEHSHDGLAASNKVSVQDKTLGALGSRL